MCRVEGYSRLVAEVGDPVFLGTDISFLITDDSMFRYFPQFYVK